jgi:hypothetical protein
MIATLDPALKRRATFGCPFGTLPTIIVWTLTKLLDELGLARSKLRTAAMGAVLTGPQNEIKVVTREEGARARQKARGDHE